MWYDILLTLGSSGIGNTTSQAVDSGVRSQQPTAATGIANTLSQAADFAPFTVIAPPSVTGVGNTISSGLRIGSALVQHRRPGHRGRVRHRPAAHGQRPRAPDRQRRLHHRRAAAAELTATAFLMPIVTSVRSGHRAARERRSLADRRSETDTPGPGQRRSLRSAAAHRLLPAWPRCTRVVWVIDGGSTVTGNPQRISDGSPDLQEGRPGPNSSPRSRTRTGRPST